ncbi:MAG: hypothetical protein JST53_16490 [Actinobacteria bacterium]|nr:hypothetical protein [Actinomycetota bacterium]
MLLHSGKKKMDASGQKRQLIDDQTEGTGRLRSGVETARAGVDRAWLAVEDAGWFLREHVAWPVEDSFYRLGRRGTIGVFGGGGVAVAGVVAALAIAGSGGSGSGAESTEAFVTPQRPPTPTPAVVAPAPKPKKEAPKPPGPTLHGAPPDFAAAKNVQSGVGDGKAVSKAPQKSKASTEEEPVRRDATAANDAPASTAKIGATPEATAAAQAQASSLATASGADINEAGTESNANGETAKGADELSGPPAPKAAKKVARRFAEAFVSYEVGGIDTKVRKAFGLTSTKQLSRSLLQRPPRQPASVKVPKAKVVNVVAGPSKGNVYTVSVSLLRVGVTSELRLEMEQGVGKKWQVTNVLG